MNTSSKIALVTGATRGMGLETVRQLAEAGVQTILTGRNHERAIAAAQSFQAQGLPVEALQLDVTDPGSIRVAAHVVQLRHGRLDVLVNNAGIVMDEFGKIPSEQTLETWQVTFATNLFGVIAVTQAFLPLLYQAAHGTIVNVSSAESLLSFNHSSHAVASSAKSPVYSVSKSALDAWTLQLQQELEGSRIVVRSVYPGSMRTALRSGPGELPVTEGARLSLRQALSGHYNQRGGLVHQEQVPSW